VTQNVDGLHRRAGHERVIELHGSLWRVRCIDCGAGRALTEPVRPPLPPRCTSCGGIERPGVVWFGEGLPEAAFEEAYEACRTADVFLSVGTSGQVHPAAGLIELARSSGRVVIEVNPEATAYASPTRYALPGPAGEILPALIRGA
jgi:NAD-dependent deacetylase